MRDFVSSLSHSQRIQVAVSSGGVCNFRKHMTTTTMTTMCIVCCSIHLQLLFLLRVCVCIVFHRDITSTSMTNHNCSRSFLDNMRERRESPAIYFIGSFISTWRLLYYCRTEICAHGSDAAKLPIYLQTSPTNGTFFKCIRLLLPSATKLGRRGIMLVLDIRQPYLWWRRYCYRINN